MNVDAGFLFYPDVPTDSVGVAGGKGEDGSSPRRRSGARQARPPDAILLKM